MVCFVLFSIFISDNSAQINVPIFTLKVPRNAQFYCSATKSGVSCPDRASPGLCYESRGTRLESIGGHSSLLSPLVSFLDSCSCFAARSLRSICVFAPRSVVISFFDDSFTRRSLLSMVLPRPRSSVSSVHYPPFVPPSVP